MIKEWLSSYKVSNQEDYTAALREVMQEIALAGLYRSGFFEKAAFYGGTALRIFHGLRRYSEDLDFTLLERNPSFSLEKYQHAIIGEFAALGMTVTIKEKEKRIQSSIHSAFLKSETVWKELILEGSLPENGLKNVAQLKIKLEIDTNPPLGFRTEERLLVKPFSFYVKCLVLPDLFAGKMHALLFRKWGTNVKGRDWYDVEWYIKNNVSLNLSHFTLRARDSGDWDSETMSTEQLLQLLTERIDTVNMKYVKKDIQRFIVNPQEIEIWSPRYFHDLIRLLKVSTF